MSALFQGNDRELRGSKDSTLSTACLRTWETLEEVWKERLYRDHVIK